MTLKIRLALLCLLLNISAVGLPQICGANFFMVHKQSKSLENLTTVFEGIEYLEEWKDVVGYEKIYQVSSFGRIKSIKRLANKKYGFRTVKERIRATHISEKLGYILVTLKNEELKQHKRFYVHRLVAELFIPNPDNLKEVNHCDLDKSNPFFKNLEWVTPSQNQQHSYDNSDRKAANIGNRYGDSFHSKPVIQYSKDLQKIKDFDSVRRASHELGICESGISMCLHGKYKTAGGFIWKCA